MFIALITQIQISTLENSQNWIANNNKQVNIVIAVDQLSCGVTLPTCDMVLFWKMGNPKQNIFNVQKDVKIEKMTLMMFML
jgi:type I site-specific restriction endonuclease